MLPEMRNQVDVYFKQFQRAPTLGGECYMTLGFDYLRDPSCFNGHPPLGVNATEESADDEWLPAELFQRAPTLGGECYSPRKRFMRRFPKLSFNGHPPLGVNATEDV